MAAPDNSHADVWPDDPADLGVDVRTKTDVFTAVGELGAQHAYALGEQAIGAMGLDDDLADAALNALRNRRELREQGGM